MYLWVEVEGGSEALAERLMEHGVVVSPGPFFGPSGEGYIRFCFARDRRELTGALESMRRLCGATAEAGKAGKAG